MVSTKLNMSDVVTISKSCYNLFKTMKSSEVIIKKPTRPAHFGECKNRLSFDEAYEFIACNTHKLFRTTGNQTPFVARSTNCSRGAHARDKVIIFSTQGSEKARAYPCCWGHITNCNRTYIDCFTKAIDDE
jgi:hypothetical protein